MKECKCPVCGSDYYKKLFYAKNVHGRKVLSDEQFDVAKCGSCGTIFTAAVVTEGFYEKYYQGNYYDLHLSGFRLKLFDFMKNLGFKRRLRIIKKFAANGKNILEIGCGQGDFLVWLPAEFKKTALEVNPSACEAIKGKDGSIQVFSQELNQDFISKTQGFDVVIMWHVLEHIACPLDFAEKIEKILSEQGLVIAEIPNASGLGFRLTKDKWFHLDTPRHLVHYTKQALKSVLEQKGLKVVAFYGNPVEYFQDLPFSVLARFKTKNRILDFMIFLGVVPIFACLRFITACFFPDFAEVNTVVIKKCR